MIAAFRVVMLTISVLSFIGCIEGKNKIMISAFITSGVLFLASVLIEGIISKM